MTSPIQVIENTIVEEPRVLGNGWGISNSIIIKTTYNDRANVLGPGSQILIDSKNFRELGQSEFYLYELKGFFLTSEEYNKQQTDEVVEIIEKNFRGNIQESYLKIKSLGREECWELPLSAVDSIDFVNKQIILVNLDSWKEALLS